MRCLLTIHLLESMERRIPSGWVCLGLVAVLAHDNAYHELQRLNRRVLAGVASGRTINAFEFSLKNFEGRSTKRAPRGRRNDFARNAQFMSQAWSLNEFLCGRGATPERRLAFQRFFNDANRRKRPADAISRHFGCPFDKLLELWQTWVDEQGIGEHCPPPPQLAEYLLRGPIARVASVETLRGERVAAIRELGEQGWLLGADRLIALLHGADDEVCVEAVWALECISGKVLGSSAAAWQNWWAEMEAASAARVDGCDATFVPPRSGLVPDER